MNQKTLRLVAIVVIVVIVVVAVTVVVYPLIFGTDTPAPNQPPPELELNH